MNTDEITAELRKQYHERLVGDALLELAERIENNHTAGTIAVYDCCSYYIRIIRIRAGDSNVLAEEI